MRVNYAINARIRGGGIGNTAYYALRAIHGKGWLNELVVSSLRTADFTDVDVRRLGPLGRIQKRLANYDSTQRIDTLGNFLFDWWAAHQLRPCEIFHGWNNHALLSLRAARAFGATTIVERGGSHPLHAQSLLLEEFRRAGWNAPVADKGLSDRVLQEFRETNYIMVPSQYNLDSFIEQGTPRGKMLLLPLGVDTQRFVPAASSEDDANSFRALFIGQVSLRKGIQYLLPAWRKAALPNAQLVIAGQVKPDAANAIQSYQSDASIRWLGHVSDPVKLYQCADVFVFPSIDEGSALVTYEAMACGLPSIVTINSGSVVRDGIDGHVVPLRDIDNLADKLTWMHDHPAERRAMGGAARAAVEPMTWDRYGTNLLMIYERCANGGAN